MQNSNQMWQIKKVFRRLKPIIQAFLDSRTPPEYLSAIQLAKPTEEADTAPVVVSDAELSALPQLIIRAGESGGVLTQTEFQITKFCAEHKLKKKTADGLLCMLRRDDFVPDYQETFVLKQFGSWKRLLQRVAEAKYLSTISGKRKMANKKLRCI